MLDKIFDLVGVANNVVVNTEDSGLLSAVLCVPETGQRDRSAVSQPGSLTRGCDQAHFGHVLPDLGNPNCKQLFTLGQ